MEPASRLIFVSVTGFPKKYDAAGGAVSVGAPSSQCKCNVHGMLAMITAGGRWFHCSMESCRNNSETEVP